MPRAPAKDRAGADSNALWWVLALLVVSRAVLAFVPWMGLWGLGVQRFLSPLEAWLPWMIAAAACVPSVARRVAPMLEQWGQALRERTLLALVTAGVAAA